MAIELEARLAVRAEGTAPGRGLSVGASPLRALQQRWKMSHSWPRAEAGRGDHGHGRAQAVTRDVQILDADAARCCRIARRRGYRSGLTHRWAAGSGRCPCRSLAEAEVPQRGKLASGSQRSWRRPGPMPRKARPRDLAILAADEVGTRYRRASRGWSRCNSGDRALGQAIVGELSPHGLRVGVSLQPEITLVKPMAIFRDRIQRCGPTVLSSVMRGVKVVPKS